MWYVNVPTGSPYSVLRSLIGADRGLEEQGRDRPQVRAQADLHPRDPS